MFGGTFQEIHITPFDEAPANVDSRGFLYNQFMKETKRKSFKFYRSYFDMFNELDDDNDKLEFITAILNKQFLGVDPNLKGLVKFAYVSQLHSIDKQVKGWQDATGQELTGAYTHPPKGCIEGGLPHPTQELEVKEEVKEEEEVKEKVKPVLHWNRDLPTGIK